MALVGNLSDTKKRPLVSFFYGFCNFTKFWNFFFSFLRIRIQAPNVFIVFQEKKNFYLHLLQNHINFTEKKIVK